MRQFSPAHLAALVVMVITATASVAAARHRPGGWTVVFSRGLALVILAGWAGEYVAGIAQGTWTIKYSLPLQLTDAVSLAAILALWSRRASLVELAYLWAFTASLQATITPDLGQSFPSVFYFTYFTYHVGVIVAAAFLVYGCRIYPRARVAWRVFVATLAFAALAGGADLITGGNYMYLRAKPVHASLLSLMSGWPWYIAEAAAAGLALLILVAARTDAIRRRVEAGGLSDDRR
ncbi:MAG: TIGR02206 family membrane protein [Actinomycetota bacterium]|nr:TIGR02206 family membrane protein [Actinomycetota bacterium]